MEPPRSTFELLFRAARLVNERAIARIQRTTGTPVRLAHTALFPHITVEGVRLTELAARLGVTKQAIGPLVDDLARARMVERVEDPVDRRAKRIRWTAGGRRALRHGLGVLAQLERELARDVGAERLAALADILEELIAAVGSANRE
jgi:DNA-binding MarR family transcriptional regulator